MTRRLLVLPLAVGCLLAAVPPARAAFTNRTAHAAVASFTATTISAPVVTSGVRCLLSNTIVVTWTVSGTAFVTSQLVEVSTSATLSPVAGSSTVAAGATTATIGGLGVLSALTVYYARVSARYAGWSTPSAVFTTTSNALC
ncbi:MAG: hypothetical protein ACXVGH_13275 [Mycobacteriales bacterium]